MGMNYTIGICGAADRVQHLQTKLFPICTLQEKGIFDLTLFFTISNTSFSNHQNTLAVGVLLNIRVISIGFTY